jgi:bla regulator protein blaR1
MEYPKQALVLQAGNRLKRAHVRQNMAALCLFYFISVGTFVGTAAMLLEAAWPPRVPRRGIWAGSMILSLFLPPILSTRHSSSVIDVLGVKVATLPAVHDAASNQLGRNLMECGAPLGQLFLRIWLVATVVLLLAGLTNALRIWLVARRSTVAEIDGTKVIVTNSTGPANAGLLRSRIFIPRWVLALPPLERSYVVRHEAEHRRAHDSRLLCLMSVFACLWPWNLALWWQLHRLHLAIEMDCDGRVVRSLGNAPAYGELLLKVAESASRGLRVQPAFAEDSSMLERRLTALVAPQSHRLLMRALAPVLAAGLIYLVLSVPHPQMERHQAEFHTSSNHN